MIAHLLPQHPRRILIYSRDEAKQAALRLTYPETPGTPLRYCVGDVRDLERLIRACEGVDLIIHAGAMKQVPACESEPFEAVHTNVGGTMNVIRAAIEQSVPRTVLLSTDKAAAPNTTYGATKFLGECITVAANSWGVSRGAKFACTRYGNVHGSTGSVVPVFERLRAAGLPFTVTDKRMTRFWMTMDEAVRLVETAYQTMQGGEVFVPRLSAIAITDLCEALDPDWPVMETGIRPREKLHECLVTREEARHAYDRGDVYVLEPPARPWQTFPQAPVGVPVPEMVYTSDVVPRLPMERLRALLGTEERKAA